MKISEKWLRSFVEINKPIEEIAEILTLRGLEVEEIAPVAATLDNIVVAEIIATEKHPNADRLRVCQVNNGSNILTIVCGAPNARAGIKVALAQIGAVLPGVVIKKSKIRDVESFGMLCSVSELGLSDKSEGIMELPSDAPVGLGLSQYLDLDDKVLDISITPNRGDCASVLGIAREVAAIEGGRLLIENMATTNIGATPRGCHNADQTERSTASLYVGTSNVVDSCPIYLIQKITNLNPSAVTPVWMKERLRRSGVRSINVPVDVTNYVMFECGQPLHAFDAQKIEGNITVRFARNKEAIELLNDATVVLDEKTIVIADDAGPIAIAGIMGGKRAAVSEMTTEIYLECAHFLPQHIARTARKFNLSSDSSYRFERGVDPALPEYALSHAVTKIIEIAGGHVVAPVISIFSKQQVQPGMINLSASDATVVPTINKLVLRYHRLEKTLGIQVEPAQIKKYFSALNFIFEDSAEGLVVTPPSYRFDIAIEEDLIEEVFRMHGCDAVVEVAPTAVLSSQTNLTSTNVDSERLLLKIRGYDEIISYSFVDEKLHLQLFPDAQLIKLLNPISQEMGVMRTSLWTGLLSTLMYNLHRQQTRVRLFEVGLCFHANNQQPKKIAGLSYGAVLPEAWTNDKTLVSFFDVKNDVEALLAENNLFDVAFLPTMSSVLHPTQSAKIVSQQKIIGELGVLHPRLVQALDLTIAPVVFELDVEALRSASVKKTYHSLSKFPEVRRDLSFIMPRSVQYQDISNLVLDIDRERLKKINIFDVYQGKGIPEGQKSVAISLILQDFSKTFTDEDVASLIKKVIDLIENSFDAKLRD